MNFSKGVQQAHSGFQMAPMVDMMFLLLVFFMVSFIFAQWETKIGITVPTAETGVESSRTPGEIIVNLDNDGKIFINSVHKTPAQLQALLGQIASTFKGQPVIIRADRHTDYEAVIEVLDICRRVDIWNVSFATLGEKEKEEDTP